MLFAPVNTALLGQGRSDMGDGSFLMAIIMELHGFLSLFLDAGRLPPPGPGILEQCVEIFRRRPVRVAAQVKAQVGRELGVYDGGLQHCSQVRPRDPAQERGARDKRNGDAGMHTGEFVA